MQHSSKASGWFGRPVACTRLGRARNAGRGTVCVRRALIVAVLLGAARARAQDSAPDSRHALVGSVRSADGSGLAGAHVHLVQPRRASGGGVVTQLDGAFRFDAVPDGAARLLVRRLGFRPETLSVDVPQIAGGPVVVLLLPVAQPLAPVFVREARRAARLGSGYQRRRANGFGHFISREEIERRNPQRTTELLRALPGITLGGSGPRFRAAGGTGSCDPVYFLDGSPLGSGTLDLDAISPKSIEAIEVYSGAATVPAALRTALTPGGCGAIVIWTRQGDTPQEALGSAADVDSLEAAVAHGFAYTADQVELAAAPLPGHGPSPAYPESLRAAGVPGRVVAEFVVDGQGRVDPETIGIVSSTHPLFTTAVAEALVGARFTPAYREGHVVRQVVHLPVVFEPGSVAGSPP